MSKVGLFFGSFNPLTNAHVALAKGVLGLVDQTWFVLSPANPAKVNKNILADEEHRREMMRLFLSQQEGFDLQLCDIEYELPRPSYTHRTLVLLKERYPEHEFHIVCGTDTLAKMISWKSGPIILAENTFICSRRGKDESKWSDEVVRKTLFIDLDIPDISSTQVRDNVVRGLAIDQLVPVSIKEYVETHGLYR